MVAIVAGGLYLSFELGRFHAGYSLFDSRRQTDDFARAVTDRDVMIEELQRQVARLETSGEIDRETYTTVEDNLGDLQARIQAQEEELAFYRGIVTPGDGVAGLRIQNVEVESVASEQTAESGESHVLRMLLVQAIVHNDRVTGSVRARLIGTLDGEPVEFGLNEVGIESSATDIPYGFRYFQTLELGLSLPDGFLPAELEIQVWPGSPRGETIVQSFSWDTISVSP